MQGEPIASEFDAVVVGARCAGAATAMLLARAGQRVLLVDRGEYGSDILSTHALMRGAVLQLLHWGLLPRVVDAGTPAVRSTTFHFGADTLNVAIKAKHGVDALYAPRRTVLDPILVDAAREAGAIVRYGVRLTALARQSDGTVDGVRVLDRSGHTSDVRTRLVVGADGMRSTVAERVAAPIYRAGRHVTASLYGYWPGLPTDGYHWHYGDRVATGVIPTNNQETLVFASMPAARWTEMGANRFAGFMRVVSEASPELGRAVAAIGERPLTGFAGHVGYYRQSWGPGWVLVGDAGYFKDPLTAHGITDALRDAELAAEAACDGSPSAFEAYQRLRDEISLGLFEVTDRISSFDWTLSGVADLLEELSRAMSAEVKAMAARHAGNSPLALSASA
jgi:flavin-dependent dehydrogenase